MDPLKLRRRKEMLGSAARAELAEQRNEDLQLLTPLEQQRAKYKQKKRAIGNREAEVRVSLLFFGNDVVYLLFPVRQGEVLFNGRFRVFLFSFCLGFANGKGF